MKRILKRISIYLLLFCIGFNFFTANAQHKLYVRLKDNTQTVYNVSDVQKLTFPSGNLVITPYVGNVIQTPLADLRFVAFQNFPVSVVETLRATSLQVYPNPVISDLYFSISDAQFPVEQINIYDITGRKILNAQLPTFNTINVSSLKAGLYFLEIYSGKEKVMRKFVKL